MPTYLPQLESHHRRSTLDWFAVALSLVVLFAPVTSVFQAIGGSEIVDVEQEECSVEIAESTRLVRQRRESSSNRVAHLVDDRVSIVSRAQVRSRVTERDFLNGTGSWLRL